MAIAILFNQLKGRAFIALLFSCLVFSCNIDKQVSNTAEHGDKIRVLVIDGQNNHIVWPKSTVMLKQYLTETGLFDVDVYRTSIIWRGEEHPAYLSLHNSKNSVLVEQPKSDFNFSPKFSDYDVVVSNFGFKAASWPKQTQLAFEDYMSNGGGFVAVHSANNAFPDWDEYNKIVGLSGWGNRDESHGPYIYFDENGKKIVDKTPGSAGAHGKKHEFLIEHRTEHPILEGMPASWMQSKDECYGKLRGPAQNLTILASALCPINEGGTGRNEPMLMTIEYGKGRVFHTTLGHEQTSFESVGFITTFLRGTQWAASQPITIEVPDDFPTATQSSTRSFVFDNENHSARPLNLKLGEGFDNPIGYYEQIPRFSWKVNPLDRVTEQTAYQIQVASSEDGLSTPDLWDSGKVQSSQTSWVKYDGEKLNSRQAIYWRVRYWGDSESVSQWSFVQTAELGLLSSSDWAGQWIGHPETSLEREPTQETLATPQYLRKNFKLNKPIKQARLYLSAKGLFKAFINGEDVAPSDVMTPGWTPYKKRIESLSYDVSELLHQGDNVLSSKIAGGWYSTRVFKFKEREFLVPARLLAQLEVTYVDGQKETIVSDDSWLATLDGPIRFASIYDGEHYKQSMELPGWMQTDYDIANSPGTWVTTVKEALNDNVLISPKRHAPIRNIEKLPVKSIITSSSDHKNGVVIFDFGQNMVGVPDLNIPVIANQEVQVRYAEALHKGKFYTENYRSAESKNLFMPNESNKVNYRPTFTYHGYRYIEITGFDKSKTPNKNWAKAVVQHSDMKLHESFKSGHAKINQLRQNIEWGLRSNFYDIPLDCPQRDERLGWTGDAQVFLTPSMYLSDVYAFWSAWLQSVREEQTPQGKIPLYIPFVEWINFASSGWGDAATIIPYELYMLTGDKQILHDNYDMMQRWLDFHDSKTTGYISSMNTFGDWLQPFADTSKNNGNRGDTDFKLISTAYYARSVEMTLLSAQALGKQEDVEKLKDLHASIKQAFNQHFFDSELNLKEARETQTTYLLGLAFDLFEPNLVPVARNKLIEHVAKADNHLRTGFLGTPLLLQELQKAGRTDLAFSILFNETYPSWFYSINNGATTTWERWNSYSIEDGFNPQGMNSLNHYAYGSVARWFYEGILGINAVAPGFTHVDIAPQFNKKLKRARGFYETPEGKIEVSWEYISDEVHVSISIPKNTTANFITPNKMQLIDSKATQELGFGEHKFTLR